MGEDEATCCRFEISIRLAHPLKTITGAICRPRMVRTATQAIPSRSRLGPRSTDKLRHRRSGLRRAIAALSEWGGAKSADPTPCFSGLVKQGRWLARAATFAWAIGCPLLDAAELAGPTIIAAGPTVIAAEPTVIATPPTVIAAEPTGIATPPAATHPEITAATTATPRMVSTASSLAASPSWWPLEASGSILADRDVIPIELSQTVVQCLHHSPAIQAVSRDVAIARERMIQEDAAFDSRFILGGGGGRTNDPVGNTLVTGGPSRLNETSFDASGGWSRRTRSGTAWKLDQELGLLDSNSQFFTPRRQGNARMTLSITQPLMAGRGEMYNTRLIVQAQIDSGLTWQRMRRDVIDRIVRVQNQYLRLCEARAHAVVQAGLVRRGHEVNAIILARGGLDIGALEVAKVEGRVTSRVDRHRQDVADIRQGQSALVTLAGYDAVETSMLDREWIPSPPMGELDSPPTLAVAVQRAIQHRPQILSATKELDAAALGVRVSRHELKPKLDAVIGGYLAGLNGQNAAFRSFGDQFFQSGPGVSATLAYERPQGNRVAKSRYRSSRLRYQKAVELLDESVRSVTQEVHAALVRVETADQLFVLKQQSLRASIREEEILTERYRLLGSDGGPAGLALEGLLEAQQRTADTQRAFISAAMMRYAARIDLQNAMGTVLIDRGIDAIAPGCSGEVVYGTSVVLNDGPRLQSTNEGDYRVVTVEPLPPETLQTLPPIDRLDDGLIEAFPLSDLPSASGVPFGAEAPAQSGALDRPRDAEAIRGQR